MALPELVQIGILRRMQEEGSSRVFEKAESRLTTRQGRVFTQMTVSSFCHNGEVLNKDSRVRRTDLAFHQWLEAYLCRALFVDNIVIPPSSIIVSVLWLKVVLCLVLWG